MVKCFERRRHTFAHRESLTVNKFALYRETFPYMVYQYIAYHIILRQYRCIVTKSNRIDILHFMVDYIDCGSQCFGPFST